jgi:hypothetical protein
LDNVYLVPVNSPIIQLHFPAPPNGWEGFQIFGYGTGRVPGLPHECYVIGNGDNEWSEWTGNPNSTWISGAYTGIATAEPEPIVRAVRQWDLMVGSDIVDPTAIAEAISTILENEENADAIARDLDEAMRRSDPEVSIEHWIDREPSLMAVIEFVPLASTGGVDIHEIAEGGADISNVIIKAAAGVMLRGGLSDHFRYLEDGTLTIDPSSPPSLDQAYELLKRTLETKETASKLENYSAWMLGMIADQFEGFFQDRFDPSIIMAQTSRAYNTYITFTHHREVEYAKHLDHEKGKEVLAISSRFNLTVLQQRKVISYARRFDLQALQAEMEEQGQDGVEDLMERIDIRAVNKRYIFFLRSANQWYEYKGPFENIPNGASPIINADTRQIMAQDGSATKPNEWVMAGVEMRPHGDLAEAAAAIIAETDDDDDDDE